MNYIVDLRDLIHQYSDHPHMYEIYRYFSLRDMIESLIMPIADYQEWLWLQCERYIGDALDRYDLDLLELFFGSLAQDLDRIMVRCIGDSYSHDEYSFRQWVNSTTVIVGDHRERYNS